jgi:small-conductance mechanosensitive channel
MVGMSRARARARRAGGAAALLVQLLALVAIAAPATHAQQPAPPGEPAPEQVRELLSLLADPAVRDWIARQTGGGVPAAAPPVEAATAADEPAGVQSYLAARLGGARAHLRSLAQAVPRVPGELARAGGALRAELAAYGPASVALLVAAFTALGLGVQRLYWWLTSGWRRRIIASPLDTGGERLRAVSQRFVYGLLMVGSFALGSLGAFLAFAWPPLLQQTVAAVLFVFLATRVATAVGRILLAPGGPRFRVLPMPQASAEHWFFWIQVIAAYAAAEFVLYGLMRTLGVGDPVPTLLTQAWAFGGVILALVALFRRPAHRDALPGARARTGLVAVWLVAAGLARTAGSFPLFVLILVAVGLPAAIGATRRAAAHLVRPPGSEAAGAEPPGLAAAALGRGVQAVLILGALWLLARSFGLDLGGISRDGPPAARLARGVLDAVVILLAADLAWHLARSWIDRRLYEAAAATGVAAGGRADGEGGSTHALGLPPEEARRRARFLTLLPILRNVGFVVFAVMALLMALSAVGVEVGPLLAGAGVVGVAVGFGAQTLVKDIISGMFFLLDDAFRVGEYIESGDTRGTVEAFSLRSIKLRHHRGYLHTVPFGSLEKITNYSRDWVIDKITIGVTYDTDLDKVKRIVKQIGKELAADPEFAPHILETLKMQGVEAYGDFAVELRLKMMTRPGEQFVIRRRAYALIKKAFEQNGISFASPTVQVSGGGGEAGPAAAQVALEALRKPAAA